MAGHPEQSTTRPDDPSDAILADPQVPEHRRFCQNDSCGKPVGRSRDGQAGRTEGFCVVCGTPFSFSPNLAPGDLVGDQYEVRGCIAFGGQGWIYLARDLKVGRDVVLKGLINTSDADDQAAMREELKALAKVDHPGIVAVHNFVEHPDRHSDATIGYIVEEYVAGRSLKDLRVSGRQPDGSSGALALRQVIEHTLEILPALGYLHSDHKLLYCDFKPDNLIQTGHRLKLVDLGAVRHADDDHSPVYGTSGYRPPDFVQGLAPSVSSDLYTVGRTMAVLSFDFTGFTTTYADALPEPDEVALFRDHESYYRLLRRATDRDPQRRFTSVEEMADQLHGVLREVLAVEEGQPHPGPSSVFGPEARAFGAEARLDLDPRTATAGAATALPAPQVDPADPAAGLLASLNATDPAQLVEQLRAVPRPTVELRLRLARTLIELDDLAGASRELDALETTVPRDWRVGWYRGVAALAAGKPDEAWACFDAVYDWLPGEAAPKLALAVSAERAGHPIAASAYYQRVWHTDRSYVSAAFGLARAQLAHSDRGAAIDTAIAALDAVPDASIHYVAAQVAAIRARLVRPADLTEAELAEADERLERLNLDQLSLDREQRERLSIDLLDAAIHWIREGRPNSRSGEGAGSPANGRRIRGRELRERDLRFGLEDRYRRLAGLAESPEQRDELVDQANLVRPRTWV